MSINGLRKGQELGKLKPYLSQETQPCVTCFRGVFPQTVKINPYGYVSKMWQNPKEEF